MIRMLLLVLLMIPTTSLAANRKVEISGPLDAGTASGSIKASDGALYMFSSGGSVWEKIFNKCQVFHDCHISGEVDSDNNIVSVTSAKLVDSKQELTKGDAKKSGSVAQSNKNQSNIFWGFRGIQWGSRCERKSDYFIIDYKPVEKGFYFAKNNENLTLGQVKLKRIEYTCDKGFFTEVDIRWEDNQEYEVTKEVISMIKEEVGEFQLIPNSSNALIFEKGGLTFKIGESTGSFGGRSNLKFCNLNIKITPKSTTPKGTF